jgi:hypothetical protein
MGNIKKEEHQHEKIPAAGDAGQQHRRGAGGRGRGRNRWQNATGGSSGGGQNSARFPTRSKDLPDNAVFDNTGQVDAANFQCSLKAIANYLHTTYSTEVSTAILKMQDVTINIEEEPTLQIDPFTNNPVPLTT